MPRKIYFCSGETVVSAVAITTEEGAFDLADISAVRMERLRPRWLGPVGNWFERYALVLTSYSGAEYCALRHRNGYFVVKLLHAVEAAIRDSCSSTTMPERQLAS